MSGQSSSQRSLQVVGKKRGAALLLVLVAITILMFLAVEVGYDTAVEYQLSSGELQSLRAYYAAKSGVEMSLYRINLYKQAQAQFKSQLGDNASMLDLIWQFPFAWPPIIPTDLGKVDQEMIQKSLKESIFDGTFITTIEAEGSKVDINDLGSPSKALSQSVRNQLVQMLKNRLDQDDTWARDNRDMRVEEIVNNIADYVDKDNESLNGGAESTSYPDAKDGEMPPNRPFKTLDEMHMVAGMTDEIFRVLLPQITVYGVKGINVNEASKSVLMSIDPQIKSEVADEIIKRRKDPNLGGPFKNLEDFTGFISKDVTIAKFNESKLPLYFGSEINFRIKSTGQFGKAQRQIIAIAYDFDTVKERLKPLIVSPAPSAAASPGPNPSPGASPTPTPSPGPSGAPDSAKQAKPGRPPVVYWFEN